MNGHPGDVPAFAHTANRSDGGHEWQETVEGMTLRQYAAIKLKQPDSGLSWLDKMIIAAKRDELETKAMQALLSNGEALQCIPKGSAGDEAFVDAVSRVVDAMLSAGKGGDA